MRERAYVAVRPNLPSSSMSALVRCVPCTAVVLRPSTPASASSAVGVIPVVAMHCVFSRLCSETCRWSGALRCRAQSPMVRIDAGSTALTLWMAAAIRVIGDSLRASTLSAQASACPSEKRS